MTRRGRVRVADPELVALWEALERHDWWCHMSDDHNVYQRGRVAEAQLSGKAHALGPEGLRLYRAYEKHVFEGGEKPTPPKGVQH